MKLIIADDHSVYSRGLSRLLCDALPETSTIEVDSLNGLKRALSTHPTTDVALVGIPLTGLVSLRGLAPLREEFQLTRFAVMSGDDTREQVLRVLGAGLHGFIPKRHGEAQIVNAVRDILSGRIYVPCSIAESGPSDAVPSFESPVDRRAAVNAKCVRLTRRQQDVLELIAEGRSNKEIARKLSLSEATVKIHATGMMRNLGVRNRTEAALLAQSRSGPGGSVAG